MNMAGCGLTGTKTDVLFHPDKLMNVAARL